MFAPACVFGRIRYMNWLNIFLKTLAISKKKSLNPDITFLNEKIVAGKSVSLCKLASDMLKTCSFKDFLSGSGMCDSFSVGLHNYKPPHFELWAEEQHLKFLPKSRGNPWSRLVLATNLSITCGIQPTEFATLCKRVAGTANSTQV